MERALELALESNSLVTAERVLRQPRRTAARAIGPTSPAASSSRPRAGGSSTGSERSGVPLTSSRASASRSSTSAATGTRRPLSATGLVDELSRHPNPHFIQVPTRVDPGADRVRPWRREASRASESALALELGRAIGDLQVLYTALESRAVVLPRERAAGGGPCCRRRVPRARDERVRAYWQRISALGSTFRPGLAVRPPRLRAAARKAARRHAHAGGSIPPGGT